MICACPGSVEYMRQMMDLQMVKYYMLFRPEGGTIKLSECVQLYKAVDNIIPVCLAILMFAWLLAIAHAREVMALMHALL